MKEMRIFEMGSFALLFACFLRACCIDDGKTGKDFQTEFFSSNFEDKTISIDRTRRLYSYDPVRWENPIPYDEGIFEKQVYVSMSNMYTIVVIDSNADEWVFKRGTAECPFFHKDMTNIEDFCIYNAKNDTLKPYNGRSHCSRQVDNGRGRVVDGVVDLGKLFSRYKSCQSIFFGDGMKGVLFWRGGLDFRWRHDFTTLLWVGKPVDYYTAKKFKKWDDFLEWDGNLEDVTQGVPQEVKEMTEL